MIRPLSPERAGPYVRALAAGLHALAPDEDFVPLQPALDLLAALDPARAGDLLDPPGLAGDSGMPAPGWMGRALAEQALARAGAPEALEASLRRAEAVDGALARRIATRVALRRALQGPTLMPLERASHLWRGPRRLHLALDRVEPEGTWVRLSLELEGSFEGPPEALSARLAPLATLPLEGLAPTVERLSGGRVLRVARGRLGPFQVPGLTGAGPETVPEARGLVLHLSLSLLSAALAGHRQHEDPLTSAAPLPLPPGLGAHAHRRFAASPWLEPSLRALCAARGVPCRFVPLTP